jgi:hypothetical protein
MTYYYTTRAGTFFIKQKDNRWLVIYQDENLGSYHSPHHAVDDLAGGHTFLPANGIDTSLLGMPDELGEWSILK